MTALAQAHIEGQRRLRDLAGRGVTTIWRELPGYDEDDVDRFLARAVPFVLAAQRQSITLTEAFLARELGRRPIGLDPASIMGAPIRNGTPPEQVYRRPFVTVWAKLGNAVPWEEAVNAGLARLVSTAQTDVQLAMRQTLRDVGERDPDIYGYERVPDGAACDLCLIASTQRYHTSELMPIHNHCGCGVDIITDPAVGQTINRERYRDLKDRGAIQKITDQRRAARTNADETVTAAVAEHGELGPVLVDPSHTFTPEEAL